MTDGDKKNEPSSSNVSGGSRAAGSSLPKELPDQEGPGRVGVELSLTKSRLRDLDSDKAISREERDLLRLYYTREQEKLQLKLRVFGEAEKIKALESAIRPNDGVQKSESQHSLGEALVNAHSELQRISTALEQLCRDDAK
jgi:hypothetical protein